MPKPRQESLGEDPVVGLRNNDNFLAHRFRQEATVFLFFELQIATTDMTGEEGAAPSLCKTLLL